MSNSPLNFFRTNQKIFFAVLTVIVMFMFVLSFGQGDFFSRLPRWLSSSKGETVAVLDGSKITTTDITTVNQGRNWANRSMKMASFMAMQKVITFLDKNKTKASDKFKPQVDNFLSTRQDKPNLMSQQGGTIPGTAYLTFQQFFGLIQGQVSPQQVPLLQNQTIDQLTVQMQAVVNDPTSKADDQELAKSCLSMIDLDLQAMSSRTDHFITVPADGKTASTMEFILWKAKAEKMGVAFSERDALSLCLSEFYGQVTEEDWTKIETELAKEFRDNNFTRKKLREALADELKVRTAITAALGPIGVRGAESNFTGGNAFIAAPFDEFKYFQKQCNQTEYGIISVPVSNFISKVQGLPSEQEMNDLFKKYRSEEPSPDRELPGFKEPRKVKLQWIEVKGDEPYFKKVALDNLPKMELQAKLSGLLVAPINGSVANLLAAPAPLTFNNLSLQSAYSEYTRMTRDTEASSWFPIWGPTLNRLSDESVVRPQTLAAAAAGAVASPLAGAVSMQAVATMIERDARTRAAAFLFISPITSPAALVGGVGPMFNQGPKPLPLTVVGDDLKKEVVNRLTRQIAFDDMTMFQDKLAELGKPKDKAPAIDYIDKFIKDRALKTGATKEYRDQYNMKDDEGLKPMYERVERLNLGQPLPPFFGPQFFFKMDQMSRQAVPALELYTPSPFPGRLEQTSFVGTNVSPAQTDSAFLVWRTDDLPAETPKVIDGRTREKIIAAWKRIKARELAKAAAEELVKKSSTFGETGIVARQKLLDLHTEFQKSFAKPEEQASVKYIVKSNVSEFVLADEFTAARDSISLYDLQPNMDIQRPTPEMRKALLDNRSKPVSTSFVLEDRPKDNFYATVLLGRDDRTYMDYSSKVYAPSFGASNVSPAVKRSFSNEYARTMREQTLNLIKAELKYDKENEKLMKDKNEE